MNSAFFAAVKGSAGRWLGRLAKGAAAVLALGGGACVDVDGGAIELSWTLRTFDGDVIDSDREEACERARIDAIRICWRPDDAQVDAGQGALSACDEARSRAFDCAADRGVTRFQVEPGRNAIWIEPVCEGGEVPGEGTYDVPAPIVREVADGEVVALRTLLVVATDGDRNCPEAGCTCAP